MPPISMPSLVPFKSRSRTTKTYTIFISSKIGYNDLPSFVQDTVAHVKGGSTALVVLGLIEVAAQSTHEVVRPDTGSEEIIRSAVRTGANKTTGLRVAATVRVEVSVGDGIEDTKESTVSVDCFHVLAIVAVQSVGVAAPLRTSWVQTLKIKM